MKRLVVTGASGLVGTELIHALLGYGGWEIVAVSRVDVFLIQLRCIRGELPVASYLRGAIPFAAIGAVEAALMHLGGSIFVGLDGIPLLAVEFFIGAVSYSALALLWCVFTHDRNFEAVRCQAAKKFAFRRNGES